jgi:hypothetical protein
MTRLRRTVAGFARGLIWMACPGLGLFAAEPPARNLPAGYQLLYSQDFADSGALKDFVFSDPAAWRWAKGEAGQPNALELHQQSQYSPRVRSPVNLALIAGRRFGDFDFEAEFVQTGREYGHRDMCVFFGAKDPANFYYVHLATKADPNAHNIFLVNDAPRTNIASRTTAGVNWGLGVWHKVRVERRLADGSIKVYFDDLTEPVMVASDKHFDYGLIGLGSFDDTGKVARIRVWGPGLAPEAQGFFR